jgi:phosphate-selective porin OprO/OprP
MKKLALFTALSACAALSAFGADDASRIKDLERRLEELDQKYKILERKLEISDEAAVEKSKTASALSIGANGFQFRSADTNFVLRIRGLFQGDARFYHDDGQPRNDRFLLRRARPIIEGTLWKNIDFLLVPEFGGGSLTTPPPPGGATVASGSILDAYLNFKLFPELQLRVGKFKSPVGLEQLQSDSQAYFIERGLPSALTPNRDMGVMLHGDVLDGVINYGFGVFNGVGDNQNSSNIDFDDEKEVAARLFLHPFQKLGVEPLEGFGLGVAGSYGNQDGAGGLPAGNGYATEAGQTFFTYGTAGANVIADGTHWRFSPQGYYYYRSFGLLGEYVISSQEVRRTDAAFSDTLDHTAWQVVGGYVLTGEDAGYRGVNPKKPFSLTDNQWGAWEVTARYSELDIDDATFPRFASRSSATEAHAFGFGLNWYANRNLRTTVNYIHTEFKGGGAGGVPSRDENAILSRVQLSF